MSSGPTIQNFSVPAGDDVDVNVDVQPDELGFSLTEATIVWFVYEETDGLPDYTSLVLSKSSDDGSIVALPSPETTFTISIYSADTAALLRNYYHEAKVVGPDNSVVTVTHGIMTVI